MSETSNSNTTTETSVPSDWMWTAEGQIPAELSPVCTLTHSSDGHYDIWTATISFSGSVPGNTHAFTGNFSFTMPAGHFTTISLSSDDTASVSVGGILSASSVWGQGTKFVGSPWIENPGATFAVSGSYGNRGGPYAINATIVVKRSKTGDVPNTDMTPQISDWRVSGPYEIKTATISFSGTAPGNMFGFSKQNVPFELDGGNWTEISVVSDDNATVSVGSVSVNSSLNAPVAFTGPWQKEYPDKVPVSISYTNVGGPYNLSVTITVKRSRRMLYLGYLYEPSGSVLQETTMHESTISEEGSLYQISGRRQVSLKEPIMVYVGQKGDASKGLRLGGLVSIVLEYSDGTRRTRSVPDSRSEFEIVSDDVKSQGTMGIVASFNDGEKISESVTVFEPEAVIVLSEEEQFISFSNETGSFCANQKIYYLKVTPTFVPFEDFLVKEENGTATFTGLLADHVELRHWHIATENASVVSESNEFHDTVGIASQEELIGVLSNWKQEYWAGKAPGEILGSFIWTIPKKWSADGNEFHPFNNSRHETVFSVLADSNGNAIGIKIISEKTY